MGTKSGPLPILKKGLAVLEKQIKEKHNKLASHIPVGKSISAEDEKWLDNGGNNRLEDKYKAAME